MRFRKLRIAWSVVCGIACVLLITVWKMHGGTHISGHFPGVSEFGVTSYCFGEKPWNDTVSAYVKFSLHAQDDSQWEVYRFFAIGGELIGGELPDGFSFRIDTGRSAIMVDAPHWLLVLFCASLAAIPWTPVVFGVRRFSLRALLITLTTIAAVLGLIVWLLK